MHIKISRYNHIRIFTLFITAFTLCYLHNNLLSQNVYELAKVNGIFFAPSIKSVKIYRTGNETSNPVIEFDNSDETVTAEFDDLSDESNAFDYTIVHCDYNWQTSDITFQEFADGFEYNQINDYSSSSGTVKQFTHYKLTLPNSNTNFKLPGNYLLKIVDHYNKENVFLQLRFIVINPMVNIKAIAVQPLNPEYRYTQQQLETSLNYSILGNVDPLNDIVLLVGQNAVLSEMNVCKPVHVTSQEIDYTSPDKLLFNGGNEYRHLDLKSLYAQTSAIQNIQFYGGEQHVLLAPDEVLADKKYTENTDLDGKYIIKRDDSNDSNIEADYLWVYFTLRSEFIPDYEIYIYGELTGWNTLPSFKMEYNPQSNAYECRVLLKQGYYNYKYVAVNSKTKEIDKGLIDGNYFDTENIYNFVCYYKKPGLRYWTPVGIKSVNSRYSQK